MTENVAVNAEMSLTRLALISAGFASALYSLTADDTGFSIGVLMRLWYGRKCSEAAVALLATFLPCTGP